MKIFYNLQTQTKKKKTKSWSWIITSQYMIKIQFLLIKNQESNPKSQHGHPQKITTHLQIKKSKGQKVYFTRILLFKLNLIPQTNSWCWYKTKEQKKKYVQSRERFGRVMVESVGRIELLLQPKGARWLGALASPYWLCCLYRLLYYCLPKANNVPK